MEFPGQIHSQRWKSSQISKRIIKYKKERHMHTRDDEKCVHHKVLLKGLEFETSKFQKLEKSFSLTLSLLSDKMERLNNARGSISSIFHHDYMYKLDSKSQMMKQHQFNHQYSPKNQFQMNSPTIWTIPWNFSWNICASSFYLQIYKIYGAENSEKGVVLEIEIVTRFIFLIY